jgi:DNA-binding NarL/FixJ family response regulator
VKDEKGRLVRDEKGNPTFELGENGKPIWVETGKIKQRTQRSTRMAETDDAMKLVTIGTPQELAYADYANFMKSMANTARKSYLNTPNLERKPEAAKKYDAEVKSLEAQLRLAELNKPKERQAQTIAAATMKRRKEENPGMTKEQERKENQKALSAARAQVGAQRNPVKISDAEWEAIQAGAISHTKLTQILKLSDKDRLRELATPRQTNELTEAQQNKIKALSTSGYTNSEIAQIMGRSTSTVSKYL